MAPVHRHRDDVTVGMNPSFFVRRFPEELIAQTPLRKGVMRLSSLIVDRETGEMLG